MSDAEVLQVITGALIVAAKIAGPILISAMLIGVFVSLIQTVTQVQEQTLSFVPKLIGTGLLLLVSGNWMLRELVTWINGLWAVIPQL